jgi:hypothetical protein
VLIDPAGNGPNSNSMYALWVVGCGADRKWRIVDGVLDNLDLAQRTEVLFEIMRKYPRILKVVCEQQALHVDIEHIRDIQNRENFLFQIQAVTGIRNKDARIERLIPKFRHSDILCPERLMYHTKDGRNVDIIKRFREVEYLRWPYSPEKDQLDALARICDQDECNFVYPQSYGTGRVEGRTWNQDGMSERTGSWLSE